MSREAKLFIAADHPLAESIHWQEEKSRLLWIDLLRPALHIHDLATGKNTVLALELPPPIGSIVLTSDPDRLVIAHRQGLSFLNVATGALVPFCDPERGRDGVAFNDMKMDRFGRLWVGSSHIKEKDARGALWCVTPAGEATLADVGFPVSNGPAFSLDGFVMYFNDSSGRQTLAYDLDPKKPGAWNRRVFATYTEEEGMPDGVVVDAAGDLWSAQWAGARVIRLSPSGEKLEHIAVPAGNVTALCFGGKDMATMYIVTARDGLDQAALTRLPMTGSLFSCSPGVKGLSEPRFP